MDVNNGLNGLCRFSPDRRVAIINAVHELFSLLLFKIRPVVMHQTFNLLTDGIGQ
jgi:hypothetical protein